MFSPRYRPAAASIVLAMALSSALADHGETWLNLARVLHAENRISEAKQAAQQALAKGVRDPNDANRIINLK